MPRTIIFLKGEDWNFTKDKLKSLQAHEDKTLVNKYGTILEFYIEAFGNPDFVACLWSNNLELAKLSIIYIRNFCEAKTTSIIGADPDEIKIRENELKKHILSFKDGQNRIKQIVDAYIEKEEKKIKKLKAIFC